MEPTTNRVLRQPRGRAGGMPKASEAALFFGQAALLGIGPDRQHNLDERPRVIQEHLPV